ncbi:condensin subunit Smc [Pleurocapsa sp. PCC 7327]|uniref:chromosome segregation protein SMC n=1 Tax=Pleurocapsa sp. PCC 7327 TaxID=118163 RepID=UPI00029FF4EF|nr:chromosome segregation protein SMC [Pleurocapsa sp. PCC 7327]AFY76477.1 condensin subunit Smc [Pleurocapsa sp. PCC 7327]
MVHIKRVELSHFKSFGGTTSVPLLPGFTVISGPNGSGKSNILDALLFCLGLATSKGMRAERLPDLVNHNHSNNRNTAETSVSVTFDVSDLLDVERDRETPLQNSRVETNGRASVQEARENHNGYLLTNNHQPLTNNEWIVTRRLRVAKGGTYASTFYINGEPCSVSELHEQLNRLRIYPEGYNVVLQGDVTRIITMNSRERREIIDELAGVAEFDRKIEKTKETLESVREREERYRLIEEELLRSLERLTADRTKAEKYKKLKATIQEKQQWETVLIWRSLQEQERQLQAQLVAGETEKVQLSEQLNALATEISQAASELDRLNSQVKALGEDEQLSVASQLATQKAKRHQLQQRQQELETQAQQTQANIDRTSSEIEQYRQTLAHLTQEKTQLEEETIPCAIEQHNQARETLQKSRERANAIAEASEAWVQEQTSLSRKISTIQETLNPQRTEHAKLSERCDRLQKTLEEQSQRLQVTEQELFTKQADVANLSTQVTDSQQQIQTLAQQLAAAEQERSIQQDTQTRLLKEQREKQRQLDKLEATKQAQQEIQGTYATQIILQSDLAGVCGLVAQLGQVDPRYQLALEIAAGGRLGYVVVEDDSVAAAGIELLKQKRAGRATFLPLNKIQPPRFNETVAMRYARGFIDLAVNLVECDSRYRNIFLYIFGSTVVFETLNDARPHLGKHRIVTLEGDLLESSGAMTGGSKPTRSSIHFGTPTSGESEEVQVLRQRLAEIEQLLSRTEQLSWQNTSHLKQLTQELTEARQKAKEQQLRLEQLHKDIQRLTAQREELTLQVLQNRQELENVYHGIQILSAEISVLEAELQQQQRRLDELEQSQTHSEWQQIQNSIKIQEVRVQEREQALRHAESELKDFHNKYQRIEEKITESYHRIEEYQQQKSEVGSRKSEVENEIVAIEAKIAETEELLQQLSERLGETKIERDRAETALRELQDRQQNLSWKLQKLQETQQERQAFLESLQVQIQTQQAELPDPLPEVPLLENLAEGEDKKTITQILEQLQQEIRNAQKRLEAMEPVNMLALEEHKRTQERLQELSEKLSTLEAERTELLLRIENFTTLRYRSFKEAFDAVNENFKNIFATLSDGDGYLQLDDPENPFNGGLNLVAHPKGKPVQRLSSMSGGEKSLTALSFIFSLQRYRPSPFYAFDEVDMFLDGANVEKLSKMIRHQAQQAQFIVVSLRRPMIESSERTIGVTQARGAYTQVLGIKL